MFLSAGWRFSALTIMVETSVADAVLRPHIYGSSAGFEESLDDHVSRRSQSTLYYLFIYPELLILGKLVCQAQLSPFHYSGNGTMNIYRNVPGLRASAASSKATPTTLCQKCLKKDMSRLL
jgi:hypothetical protein